MKQAVWRTAMIRRLTAILAAAAALASAGCKPPLPEAQARKVRTNVATWAVQGTDIHERISLPGIVEPDLSVTVSAEIPGVVSEVAARESDEIEAGGVLLRFDKTDLELAERQAALQVKSLEERLKEVERGARDEQIREAESAVEAARAMLDLAKSSAERRRNLVDEKVLPREALDQAEAQQKQAQSGFDRAGEMLSLLRKGALEETKDALRAQIEAARSGRSLAGRALSKAEVRSPISGIVQKRHIDPNEFAGPGQPLFEVIRKSPLRIVLGVPERIFTRMKKGDEVKIRFKSLGAEAKAAITRLGFAADRRTQTFDVAVEIPNPLEASVAGNPGTAMVPVRPGLIAEVTFGLGVRENAIAVPSDAILLEDLNVYVFVLSGGLAKARPVRVGMKQEGMIEILEGLAAGEELIVSGQKYVKDGDEVNVVSRRKGALAK